MVGTPEQRHATRHRRVAAILARRAIARISPIRDRDRRAERRRLAGDRRRRARAALLRGMREVLGLPILRRQRRLPQPPQPDPNAPILLSSNEEVPWPEPPLIDLDSSLESLPNIDPRPQFQLPIDTVADLNPLDSSLDSLPDIDPRPQFQLHVEPLVDLGPLNITVDYPPPLHHQTLREAYVLLQRLQLPPFQPITPPPEHPPRVLTPPPDQEGWVEVDAAVATINGQDFIVFPQPLELQQPEVVPEPEFMPAQFVQPQQLPQVDWAGIAAALFTIAEHENRRAHINLN